MALPASFNTDGVLSSSQGALILYSGHARLIFKPGSFRFLETIMGGAEFRFINKIDSSIKVHPMYFFSFPMISSLHSSPINYLLDRKNHLLVFFLVEAHTRGRKEPF